MSWTVLLLHPKAVRQEFALFSRTTVPLLWEFGPKSKPEVRRQVHLRRERNTLELSSSIQLIDLELCCFFLLYASAVLETGY